MVAAAMSWWSWLRSPTTVAYRWCRLSFRDEDDDLSFPGADDDNWSEAFKVNGAADADDMRNAVRAKFEKLLTHADSPLLTAYKSKEDAANSDDPLNGDDSLAALNPTGTERTTPYYIVAPASLESPAKLRRLAEYVPFLKALYDSGAAVTDLNWLDKPLPSFPVNAEFAGIFGVHELSSMIAEGTVTDVTSVGYRELGEARIVSACTKAIAEFLRDANEDGLHAVLTPYTDLSKALLDAVVARNAHDASLVGTKRPDAVCTYLGNVVIWRQEEKSSAGDLSVAVNELTDKMERWNADFYGPLTWVLGFAIADAFVNVFQLSRGVGVGVGGTGVEMLQLSSLNLTKATNRVELLRIHACYARYLRKRGKAGDFNTATCRTLPFVQHERNGGTKITIYDDKVVQTLPHEMPSTLREFYTETRHLIGVEHLFSVTECGRRLSLGPVCRDRLPADAGEYRDALRGVARALRSLHHLRWCHLDVRWPNIVFNTIAGVWTLIDCEYVCRIGDAHRAWPDVDFVTKDPLRGDCVGTHTDCFLLGKLASGVDDIGVVAGQLMSNDLEARRAALANL